MPIHALALILTRRRRRHCALQVEQLSCVVRQDELMLYLLAVIKVHMKQDPDFKVRVDVRAREGSKEAP